MILHLNGMPGAGKLTVARLLCARLNARLLDNHSILDPVLALHERGSAPYIAAVLAETGRLLEESDPRQLLILTNALAEQDPDDRTRLKQVADHARRSGRAYVQALLLCQLEENQRRLVAPERAAHQKLRDPALLAQIHRHDTLYHPPTRWRLTLDTTHLTADETAGALLAQLPEEFHRSARKPAP